MAERRLLQLVVQPSGKTIEQLAHQATEYERVQVSAAEVLATDQKKLGEMVALTHDPARRPPNLQELGATVNMFGSGKAVRHDELKAAVKRYDEILSRKRQTFEDHFWAVHYAFTPYMLVNSHWVDAPLSRIPGANGVFTKRCRELREAMMREEVPHLYGCIPASVSPSESAVRLAKRQGGFARPPATPYSNSLNGGHDATLITRDQAKNFTTDLNILFGSKFRSKLFDNDWRVARIDIDMDTYGIVFPDITDSISLSREELIDVLTESWLLP